MFTEAQNFAIVQTELDSVFYQNFDYENSAPGLATARTGEIFKVLNTTHAAYIEEIYKGSELFSKTAETGTVALTTPKVANKLTTYIADFTKGIELSKNLFDDNMHKLVSQLHCAFV
jgi:hypothetical protein